MRCCRSILGLVLLLGLPATAQAADVALAERFQWKRSADFFVTGAPLALDSNANNTIDSTQIAQPATVTVRSTDIPAGATILQAFLYWAGSVPDDNDCSRVWPNHTGMDDTVLFTPPPTGSTPVAITADVCHCSDGQNSNYDIQACRADVTALITDLDGPYTVDGFDAYVDDNSSTTNASFAIVLIYRASGLNPRKIAIYDGIQTVWSQSTPSITFTLGGIEVDNPPSGDLTWYVLEGDIGGADPSFTEEVTVNSPGNTPVALSDGLNPADNPMNRTINTSGQFGVLGTDIDMLPFGETATPGAVTAGATELEVTYSANNDKWWIVFNIVGINVFQAVLGATSTKTWVLQTDADGDGQPTAGDTIRYTIHLDNSGNAPAVVDLTDDIPAEAAAWGLVSATAGTDGSTANQLVLGGIALPVGASADIVFDVLLDDVPDETRMVNSAAYDAGAEGAGSLRAPDVIIRKDTDLDGHYDNDDNCPSIPNPTQADSDGNGAGDACDVCSDADNDSVCDAVDNCPGLANSDQADGDFDGIGDVCDACDADPANDVDGDGVCGNVDNCPRTPNANQADRDFDGIGDACENCPGGDIDGDGTCDVDDNCPSVPNPRQEDSDNDGVGDACEPGCVDDDGDRVCDTVDTCVGLADPQQEDRDRDGVGDGCDNCPDTPNADQIDSNGDGIGNACTTGSGPKSGCSCDQSGDSEAPLGFLGLLALAWLALRRRRHSV